jgi:predicted site-specific integrase-resolvase
VWIGKSTAGVAVLRLLLNTLSNKHVHRVVVLQPERIFVRLISTSYVDAYLGNDGLKVVPVPSGDLVWTRWFIYIHDMDVE